MTAISTQRVGDELYVYHGLHLIYKRWISTGQSHTFHAGEGARPSGLDIRPLHIPQHIGRS